MTDQLPRLRDVASTSHGRVPLCLSHHYFRAGTLAASTAPSGADTDERSLLIPCQRHGPRPLPQARDTGSLDLQRALQRRSREHAPTPALQLLLSEAPAEATHAASRPPASASCSSSSPRTAQDHPGTPPCPPPPDAGDPHVLIPHPSPSRSRRLCAGRWRSGGRRGAQLPAVSIPAPRPRVWRVGFG